MKEVKECCDKNKEGLAKVEEEEKKVEKKEDAKVWDKNINRFAAAKLIVNYKPDWTIYVASNYPLEKQNKAL